MSNPFVDTDIIIRPFARDDARKQAQAAALFQQVESGSLTLEAPDTVIADAVYVLASRRLYAKSRAEIQAMLTPLIRLPGFQVRNRRVLLHALEIHATTNLGFGDAMILSTMEQRGSRTLYSYDRGFDRSPRISRVEP